MMRILLPMDGSERSLRALDHVLALRAELRTRYGSHISQCIACAER